MSSKKTARAGAMLLGTLILCVGSITVGGAAVADPVEPPTQEIVALNFDGYDAERALSNGYEVRSTDDGWEYAVPVGTPDGSMENATPLHNPLTGEVLDGDGVGARGSVTGNCGTSTLTLYSKTSGYTAYSLNGSFGGSLFHSWFIDVSSMYGAQEVDRSGLPPFPGALNWGTNFAFNVGAAGHGTVLIYGLATGVVVTSLGTCSGMGAPDTIWA